MGGIKERGGDEGKGKKGKEKKGREGGRGREKEKGSPALSLASSGDSARDPSRWYILTLLYMEIHVWDR